MCFDLIRVEINIVQRNDNILVTVDDFEQTYPSLICGIYKLKNFEVKFQIDENAQPVAEAAPSITFHLRKKVSPSPPLRIEARYAEHSYVRTE